MKVELSRLDELASDQTHPVGQDSLALELMESFAQTEKDVRALVERYGASTSPYVVAALTFLLAQLAGKGVNAGDIGLFSMLRTLKCHDEPVILQSLLSAIHRTLIFSDDVPAGVFEPEVGNFVLLAFRYFGKDAWVVHLSALDVLSILGERNLLPKVFSAEQRRTLARETLRLKDCEGELLEGNIEPVIETLSSEE